MLKKLRWRFIIAAMTAFGTVMLLLVTGINFLNYSITTKREDDTLAGILEYERLRMARPAGSILMISEMPWAIGAEVDFTTRFFVVHYDREGDMVLIFKDHISVDEDTIRKYADKVLSEHRTKGSYKEYRYAVNQEEAGTTIIFLDVSGEQKFVRSLLKVSLAIALVSLLGVFGLIVLFSKRAIAPYVRNIERQKRFITDAGHELKTPLTSIATSADIAAMETEENEWIENIRKQTARLTRLVNDLVALSRLDEEQPFPEKSIFSLSDAAWEAAEPFAALAKACGKQYTQQIEEGMVLLGDQNTIRQMISILLDNAVRYSEEGGEIRLRVYRRYNKICLEVFNTCHLMEDADPERWFDRFYRPDESRSANTGGTGIGLSMAQAIAEAHGGRITAESPDKNQILFRVLI